MRYVILRDDDTNALTPVDCLERLYRPFLDHGLPVNLAVIPDVATDATTPDGRREGFLLVDGEHRTSNIEHRTPNGGGLAGSFGVRRSMFDVRCSVKEPSEQRGTLPIGDNREL